MADIKWEGTQSNLPQTDYIAQAKGFLQNPQQAFDVSQYDGQSILPQDYFNGEFADKIFNTQASIMGMFTKQQEEMRELKEHYDKQYQSVLSNMLEMQKTFSSNNPTSGDYMSAHTNSNFKPNHWQSIDSQEILYKAFRNKGYDHNQTLGILMNIEAENSFGDKYIFGTHQDGNKTAYGLLSWQGGREVPLLQKLQSAGLYDPNTKKITVGEQALQIQADFFADEIKSGKYSNYSNFSARNPLEYARYLNQIYVKSSTNPNVLKGRERAYNELLKNRDWAMYLNQNNQAQQGNTAPSSTRFLAKTLSGQVWDFSKYNYGGAFQFNPLQGKHNIASGFGEREAPVAGASTWHPAIDIVANDGTQIYSPFANAEVYETGSDKKAGNYITLRDVRTGYYWQVMHLGKLNFTKGQKITNKDIIALSGHSGIGTGSHIDWRLFNKEGYAISPTGEVSKYRHKLYGRS